MLMLSKVCMCLVFAAKRCTMLANFLSLGSSTELLLLPTIAVQPTMQVDALDADMSMYGNAVSSSARKAV